jgi:hypothetical protein
MNRGEGEIAATLMDTEPTYAPCQHFDEKEDPPGHRHMPRGVPGCCLTIWYNDRRCFVPTQRGQEAGIHENRHATASEPPLSPFSIDKDFAHTLP